MNILILGNGGREHTFCWKLSQSAQEPNLFIAPGNAGTAQLGTNIDINPTDLEAVATAVNSYAIDLILVGPEAPLVAGIHDHITNHPKLSHIPVIGPKKEAAQLEGSKAYAKAFMERHNIPTAPYKQFDMQSLNDGLTYLETIPAPYVLKADGLAAGKGVLIIHELEKAKTALIDMLVNKKFGAASEQVVIEGFLDGIELSCFVLTDGESHVTFPFAKDYKRIGEGDTGLNTGGMGAVSPVPFNDSVFKQKIHDRIITPTIQGLKKDKLNFIGFVFIGLIRVGDDPFVIEYNVRMGDPETQVVLPRIQNDMAVLLQATCEKRLHEVVLQINDQAAATVVSVAGGYPEAYEKGEVISGLTGDGLIFQAGTSEVDNQIVTNGGRVLASTGFGADVQEALTEAYSSLSNISFKDMYFRKDLGFDL
ncbi:MAG: phosphoribosylamine--glycine ligase [Flavobacteriaceae bacterium]|nr:phosphoribosylamine--glycine ligase [Flavobacteriaceae bacterium]